MNYALQTTQVPRFGFDRKGRTYLAAAPCARKTGNKGRQIWRLSGYAGKLLSIGKCRQMRLDSADLFKKLQRIQGAGHLAQFGFCGLWNALCNRVLLMTADSDQIPLVQELRERCPTVSVEILAPPGRLQQARQLCDLASGFREITPGRLGTCRLARNVPDESGKVVARCPALYNTTR